MRLGVYEQHHLLCPVHGRTVKDEASGRASCGCTPWIWWEIPQGVRGAPEVDERIDNLGLRERRA